MGVFLPCCLSIFGVILFLRLSWIVGQAGLVQTFGMIILAYAVDVFTVLSISAIATNGEMKGGGAYCELASCLPAVVGCGSEDSRTCFVLYFRVSGCGPGLE